MTLAVPDDIPVHELLQTLQAELELLAEKWLSQGANSISLLRSGSILWQQPENVSLDFATAFSENVKVQHIPLTLTISGMVPTEEQRATLSLDAAFLERMLKQELEVAQLTEAFIENQDQLLALYDLTHALQHQVELQDVLHKVAEQARILLRVNHVALYCVIDDPLPELIQNGELPVTLEDCVNWLGELRTGRGYLNRLVHLPGNPTACAMVQIPLVSRDGTVIGGLGLFNLRGTFPMPEIKLATSLAEQSVAAIEKALLYKEHLQQTQTQTELNLARNVQLSLLPEPPDDVAGIGLWAQCKPAQQVGGDFYDYRYDEDSNLLYFSLGDVAGKGMSAALLMAMSRTFVRASDGTPLQILDKMNRNLYDDLTEVGAFVTAFVGSYNPQTHLLTYSNAGHAPVIHCPQGTEPYLLDANGPPVGLLRETMLGEQTLEFALNDVLIVISDGFPEAANADGEQLGYDNLLALIDLYRDRTAREIAATLLDAVQTFERGATPSDDQTILVLKRME
jgi:sigma-B regulation protein RsbU (phosphoserine phosphatase)